MKFFLISLLLISVGYSGVLSGQLGMFPVQAQHATGFSNMVSPVIGEIGSGNPAAADSFSKMAIGLNFKLQTTAETDKDYYTSEFSNASTWLPSSFGLVLPLKNWRFGLAFHKKYNESWEAEIKMPAGPDSGKVVQHSGESIIYSPSVLLSYSFPAVFTENDRLTIGAQFFWNVWNYCYKWANNESSTQASGFNWKAGILYRVNKRFGLGLTYESKTSLEGDVESNQPSFSPSWSNEFVVASRLSLGVELKTTERLTVAGTAMAYFWNDVEHEYNNALNLSFSTLYDLTETLKLSLGFYQMDRIYESYNLYYDNYGSSIGFLSGGLKASFDGFDARLEVLDSHLFSSERNYFTIFKIGLDYTLGR